MVNLPNGKLVGIVRGRVEVEADRVKVQSLSPPSVRLLRILGLGFGLAVIIGGTLGVGILRMPGAVASQLGNYWLIIAVWVAGGLYALLGSISLSELGTMLPQAGGYYVYARRAFNDYIGFMVGWSDWLAACTSLAYAIITIGEYAGALVPALAGGMKPIALGVLLVFASLHWKGVQLSSRTQQLMSLLTALAFLALFAACFAFGGAGSASGTGQMVPALPGNASAMFIPLIIALRSVIATYDGWQGAIYFAEEDHDPVRNLPRSMIGGVVSIALIYLLVNLALLYAVPLDRLAASTLPAADAAQTIFGDNGVQIITVVALVSLLSLVNAVLMVATRIMFAMSRDGLFLDKVAKVHDSGTPRVAMVLSALAALLLMATGTFERLVAIAAFFFVANYVACFACVFVLRWREPELPRPFKAWGYPWTTLIVLVGGILFLAGMVVSDTTSSISALLLLAAGYPAYLIVRRRSSRFRR
jgi:basic amino acid/polyamine antiporter, APA family